MSIINNMLNKEKDNKVAGYEKIIFQLEKGKNNPVNKRIDVENLAYEIKMNFKLTKHEKAHLLKLMERA